MLTFHWCTFAGEAGFLRSIEIQSIENYFTVERDRMGKEPREKKEEGQKICALTVNRFKSNISKYANGRSIRFTDTFPRDIRRDRFYLFVGNLNYLSAALLIHLRP